MRASTATVEMYCEPRKPPLRHVPLTNMLAKRLARPLAAIQLELPPK